MLLRLSLKLWRLVGQLWALGRQLAPLGMDCIRVGLHWRWSLRVPNGSVGLLRSATSLEQMPRMTPDRVKLAANYLLRLRQLQLQRDVLPASVHVLMLRVEYLVLVLELERRATDELVLLWCEAALESVAWSGTNGRSKTGSRAAA